jgi:L1 cell adhesion molecule like protein
MSEKENQIIKAIGIDLGTTHSCIGIFRNGRVEIATNDTGTRVTPSMVTFTEKEIAVGIPAKNIMGKYAKSTIYDSKRLIGRNYDDPIVQEDKKFWPFEIEEGENNLPKYKIPDKYPNRKEYPIEISTLILKRLKDFGSDLYGEEVTKAVITVPAYFNNSQREATKKAGIDAGLDVLRILNEPTAAAIAYGFQNKCENEKHILVFDLGGGTFDVSILRVKNKTFEVLATCGDNHLGGEDFNQRLMKYLIDDFKEKTDIDLHLPKYEKSIKRLVKEVENAKIQLSSLKEVSIDIDGLAEGEDFFVEVTRSTYEDLCKDLWEKCYIPLQKALDIAKLTKEQIDDIVLAGGSSRTPKIQEMVKEFFNGKEVCKSINADEAIAYGATIVACKESNFSDQVIKDALPEEFRKQFEDDFDGLEIIDATPLPVGIEVAGGKMQVIIPKGTKLPEMQKTRFFKKAFALYKDFLTAYNVDIYEGEDIIATKNNKLGHFRVTGIPPKKKGEIIIELLFYLDHDSIITVKARCNDEIQQELQIKKH